MDQTNRRAVSSSWYAREAPASNDGGLYFRGLQALGNISNPSREGTLDATQPSSHATPRPKPIVQLLSTSRKAQVRSSTALAPKALGLKHGNCSRGVEGSTKIADHLLGFEVGAPAGDVGIGADAIVVGASTGGTGVERVVLGILITLRMLMVNS